MGLLIKLQNGDTALKSLKFGKDRPGGGDSGQPYIKEPLLDNPLPESPDFLLRGGLNAPIDAATDVVRLTKYMFDLKSPSGLLFIAKQNLLSRVAPKTEASKGIGYAGGVLNEGIYTPLSTLAQAGVGFAGIHLNKQGIDPTGLIPGLSINKYEKVVFDNNQDGNNRLVNYLVEKQDFFLPLPNLDSYSGGPGSILGIGRTKIAFAQDGNGAPLRTGINNFQSITNKKAFYNGGLVRPNSDNTTPGGGVDYSNLLGASKKENLTEFETGINSDGNFTTLYNPSLPYSTLSKYNPTGQSLSGSLGYQVGNNLKYQTQESDTTYYSPIGKKLQEYGRELLSDSTFTVGNTWTATSQINNQQIPGYNSQPSLAIDPNADIDGLNNTEISSKLNSSEPNSNNKGYLANLNKNAGSYVDPTTNVYTFQQNPLREGGRGIAGDFRLTNRKKRGFFDAPGSYDYITDSTDYSNIKTLDRIYYNSSSSKRKSNKLDGIDDLITFNFKIINPTNPSIITPLNFRAYIDNFSDSYDSDWKSQTYMGRAEKFYKYDSFGRSISLGFTIVADNETNLGKMYEQLNTLAASLAPTYTTYGYMAGNLHKLTVGNYINNQVGIMDGLTYEVIEESPWEITKGNQLPMYIRVTGIKFTPIHNFRPESQFNTIHQFINQ